MATGLPRGVVWIMSDQHSVRATRFGGNGVVSTPSLDGLRRQGCSLDNMYTASPVCTPSRFAALTGLYPHTTGCVSNLTPLPHRFRTAAHHMGQAGYFPAYIGKLHAVDGQTHGFEYCIDAGHYYDYLGPKTEVFCRTMQIDSPFVRGGRYERGSAGCCAPWLEIYQDDVRNPWLDAVPNPHLPADLPPRDRFGAFVMREAERFLTDYRDERFFLFVSFLEPHEPYLPPGRFRTQYDAARMVLPPRPPSDRAGVPGFVAGRRWPTAWTPEGDALARSWLAAYYGNVSFMDHCVGYVLRALDGLGLAEDTLVIYTSDHGDMMYEHGMFQKGVFYEACAHVPCLVRFPGRVAAGASVGAVGDLTALLPTTLELCGLPRPEGIEGRSLAEALRRAADPSGAPLPAAEAFSEIGLDGGSGGRFMLRLGEYKYCRNARDRDELYNLVTDPLEFSNLLGEHGEAAGEAAEVADLLRERLVARVPTKPYPLGRATMTVDGHLGRL